MVVGNFSEKRSLKWPSLLILTRGVQTIFAGFVAKYRFLDYHAIDSVQGYSPYILEYPPFPTKTIGNNRKFLGNREKSFSRLGMFQNASRRVRNQIFLGTAFRTFPKKRVPARFRKQPSSSIVNSRFWTTFKIPSKLSMNRLLNYCN